MAGILYSPATLQPVYSHTKDGLTDVPFESPLIRWTQAARDVASLHGCTPITLDDLAAYGVAT
ncbi:hypothetical protein SLNWT_0137 [Streptomyces albus]|uniref:Uncharacterized protein n=1 Tax=Streptomyces albus (strain ATCC 21838 / DSM 41398 / FERM P-419 / JCM 4703 / NBRC 107858) TaxID=1081613 RepID=A0A0B5EEW9_STRA4|nr:hypothetical protein SLNWT_0137 [Streptomyces albus]